MKNARLDGAQAGIKIAGISITSVCRWHHSYGRKQRGTKETLDEGERGQWKTWLKTQHGPITSWQIDGETKETVAEFILGGSKITADGDWSHEIKRQILFGKNTITNIDSVLKSRDITNKVRIVKGIIFSSSHVGMWELAHTEGQRTDAFELWCWRRLLRVPWTARRSNQSILKEINPEYLLEGLMLKLSSNTLATWCEEQTH